MKISVITPSFNAAGYIARAIDSVCSQGYDDFEHIVVDGLSRDGTVEKLKEYPHLHWISEKDSGQSDAMNKGFSMASGEVVVYLNADDYFLPGVFQAVAQEFDKGAEIVLGDLRVVTNNGNQWLQKPSTEFMDVLMHWKGLFPLNPVQYFLRRSLHQGLSYNVDNHLAMDHEFLLELFSRAKPTKLDMAFGVFDMVDGSKTAEGLKRPGQYWTHENFAHVDRFLARLAAAEIVDFKNQQCDFFRAQQLKYTLHGFSALQDELDRYESFVVYGAGTQFEGLRGFCAEKITHVVDQNLALHGTTVSGFEVQSPEILHGMKSPVIVVSAFGYRDAIANALASVADARLIFVEDFFR